MALMRLRASGTWNGGEVFNFGVHVDTQRSVGDAADVWAAALTEMWSGAGTPAGALNTLYNPNVTITEASAAEILLASGQQQTKAIRTLNLPGVATDEQLPPQVAVVVSLRTQLANRAGRGRFYLPAMATNAIAAGRLDTAAQTVVRNSAQRLFNSLRTGTIQTVIWTKGLLTPRVVTDFSVGDVMDTQRRRRNQLTEVRISGTV